MAIAKMLMLAYYLLSSMEDDCSACNGTISAEYHSIWDASVYAALGT